MPSEVESNSGRGVSNANVKVSNFSRAMGTYVAPSVARIAALARTRAADDLSLLFQYVVLQKLGKLNAQ